MATLFKEVNYNLATLIQQIDMGVIGLPDIQGLSYGRTQRCVSCLTVCIEVIL